MSKINCILLICFAAIFLTGCWDSVNIEDRGFILATGIDMSDEAESQGDRVYSVISQLAIPGNIATNANSGGGGGAEKPFVNISQQGKSIYRNNEELVGVMGKMPFFRHIGILVLSRETAETDHAVSEILDPFIRNTNIRRSIKVVVSEGTAKEILDFSPPEEPLPAKHLQKLLSLSKKHSGYLPALSLGDLEKVQFAKRSYVLPLLEKKEQIEYKKGAVMKGGKMVGSLNEEEIAGLEFFLKKAKSKDYFFDYEGKLITVKVAKQVNNLKIDAKDKHDIKVNLDVELEGIITEDPSRLNLNDNQTILAIEKASNKKVEDTIQKTIDKAQKDYHADIFHIWKKLEIKDYDIWKQVEKDWEDGEDYFSNVTFHVTVNSEIYSTGTSNRTD
jgi:spore germination protein